MIDFYILLFVFITIVLIEIIFLIYILLCYKHLDIYQEEIQPEIYIVKNPAGNISIAYETN